MTENQPTDIPLGTTHRPANPGKIRLEPIEVQSGTYLGEDDTARLDGTYGRAARQATRRPPRAARHDRPSSNGPHASTSRPFFTTSSNVSPVARRSPVRL
ncbi:hypothetical protein [Burkholderia anthinoferrum]|uniref:hypothetical protein n=1 Tax=Burkholderia TaxID=32008 RepID=UPI000B7A8CC0|nr:hypothetical protein [Burkholderia anthinoferrum]MDF3095774.1 hypothetical protein [Burkholderia semiarida]MEB2563634.1 hypothetical protein [Burkholderia anthinoferrum]OXI25768.1 hypothetical protein CFB35_03500 [Burkholderia sp. AU16482]